jgi:predicted membrane protein
MDDQYKDDFKRDFKDEIHRSIHENIRRNMRERMQRSSRPPGMAVGLILIAVGTLFLLGHMGLVDTGRLWKFWPLIIVVVGLVKFFKERSQVGGAITIVIGVLLQLNQLGYLQLSWGSVWPLILIAAGIAMIWSRFEVPKFPTPPADAGIAGMGTVSGTSSYETLNEYALFGGIERRMHTNSFRGGSIVSVFGGVEVDFLSADIEGQEAVIYVEAIFGGIELRVPERWKVVFQGQSIFGGYSDETRPPLADTPGSTPRKALILRGKAVFGGINVKN